MRWRRGSTPHYWPETLSFLFGADVEQLLTAGDAVRGVRITASSGVRSIAARRGVVLATGGFLARCRSSRKILSRCRWSCLPQRFRPGREMACGLAMAGGGSIGTTRRQSRPIGYLHHGFGGLMAARVFSRIRSRTGRSPASSRSMRPEDALSMKRCPTTSLFAPCWPTATTVRVVRSTSSATVDFSGGYGLGRIKPFTWRIKRYVRSGELIEAPGHR